MRKRILSIILCLVLILCCGCQKSSDIKITGEDTELSSRLENIVELQKSLFVATVNSVETVDAVFTKYNIDISKYTLYNITIEKSFDGYTPLGNAKVYVIGTSDEFNSRIGLVKNEKYILDAEPWVYGDEVVYLLSPYTVSFPKIDISNGVTIAVSDSEALSAGTVDSYTEQYNNAVAALNSRIDGFSDIKSAAKRYSDIFSQINEKNADTGFYSNGERVFDWTPDSEHIQKTADKSKAVSDTAAALAASDTVTAADITKLFK